MNYALSGAGFFIAAGWLSGVAMIAKLIGGIQWVAHTGQMRTVGMLMAAGAICAIAGLVAFGTRRIPKGILCAAAVIAGVHLVNAIGMYMLLSTNGRAGPEFMPFALFSSILPTSTQFIGMPAANASLFILPVATLLAAAFSLAFGMGSRSRSEA